MSKNSASSALLALVLALAVFFVALMLLLFIGDFGVIGSLFMAFVLAAVIGIVLLVGFAAPATATVPAMRAAAPTATSGAVATPPPPAAEADTDAEAERRADEEAETERRAAEAAEAERQEAARAEAERKAAEEAAAKAEAARISEEEAAARAEAERQAEADRRAAENAAATAATASAPVPSGEDHDGDGVAEGTDEGTRPEGLDAPRDGKADDLKQIKGIGAKMETLCNRLGFWHFDQIANWTADEVAWVDANLEGFKGRVTRDDWVGQAKILASGGETDFSKRVGDGDVY